MIKRTLSQVRPELSRIAATSGLAVTDPTFIRRLNHATEELMNAGDWPGIVDRYRFAVYGGLITLPGDLNAVLGVAIDGSALEMASPWYEFVAAGPGPQDGTTWIDNVLDRGEACTIQQIPAETPCTLEVEGTFDERVDGDRPSLIIRGYDENGEWIRSSIGGTQDDGLAVAINGDTNPKLIESSVDFLSVESVIKPQTKGFVRLYANNDGTRYHLATYAPDETVPSYRRYAIPFASPEKLHTVMVRARKRFVPVDSDNDILLISNMPALETMLMAIQKREADDFSAYGSLRQVAVALLSEEATAYRGKTRKPAITFSQGSSLGYIPHVR
jgi:hypothetical protein